MSSTLFFNNPCKCLNNSNYGLCTLPNTNSFKLIIPNDLKNILCWSLWWSSYWLNESTTLLLISEWITTWELAGCNIREEQKMIYSGFPVLHVLMWACCFWGEDQGKFYLNLWAIHQLAPNLEPKCLHANIKLAGWRRKRGSKCRDEKSVQSGVVVLVGRRFNIVCILLINWSWKQVQLMK